MFSKKFLVSIIIGLCALLFSTGSLWAGEYEIIQLSDNGYENWYPEIHNGQVVWSGHDGNDDEIFLYDGIQTIQLTDNDYDDGSYHSRRPQIHNGQVVWYGNGEIFFYDGVRTIQIDSGDQPQIHNGQVVWERYDGNDDEIFFYDGAQTIQLTDNDYIDWAPQIYNGELVWVGFDGNEYEIFLYDGTQTIQLTDNNYGDWSPQINNGQVTWMGYSSYYDDEDSEIFLYDGNQTIQLTDNDYDDKFPQIHNGQAVWYGFDGNDYEIFFYDGTQTIQLTDNDYIDYSPKIHNGQVTWVGDDGNDREIFLYDGKQTIQLTDNDYNDYSPKIHNGQVTWRSYVGSDYQIFLATPVSTSFTLTEQSSATDTLTETLLAQNIALNNVNVTGNLNGTLNFTDFKIVKITTGAFAEQGFFNANWQADLGGSAYSGSYQGLTYFDPDQKKIHLKGNLSGDLTGITEATLTESTPGSGLYDTYQATWTLNRIKGNTVLETINLEGDLSYGSDYTFVSNIDLYQANMEGTARGYYAGGLSAVLTNLRLSSAGEYENKGFSRLSYITEYAAGEAYSYGQFTPETNTIEFQGISKEPLLGVLFATLDEETSPKTLSGTIERIDLGATYESRLKVKIWGPERISPGDTIIYTIEYRNDGAAEAENVFVSSLLSTFVKYISASDEASYSPYGHELIWKIGNLPPKTTGYLTFQAEVIWGLPQGLSLKQNAYIMNIGK